MVPLREKERDTVYSNIVNQSHAALLPTVSGSLPLLSLCALAVSRRNVWRGQDAARCRSGGLVVVRFYGYTDALTLKLCKYYI